MSLKIASRIKELRLHLCQTGPASKGAREFIEKYYVNMKECNPTLPILIRECNGVQPRIWVRYENGKENCATLTDLSSEDVMSKLNNLTK